METAYVEISLIGVGVGKNNGILVTPLLLKHSVLPSVIL
jgi:hypothetical protein